MGTKCNDIQNTSYCPRGAFCAFAHLEQESLDNGPEGGPNFAEILNKALPDSDHSSCDSQSDRSSNSGEMGEYSWGENSRAPGSHLNPIKAAQPTTPPNILDSINSGHSSIPASPTYHKMRTSSGDSCRLRNKLMQIENDPSLTNIEKNARRHSILAEFGGPPNDFNGLDLVQTTLNNSLSNIGSTLFSNANHIEALGGALDDLSITDLYEGSKSRKSSGFSETTKSRNCSGNSISQGLVSSGFLSSSTNPVNIPGSGESLLDRNDGFGLLSTMTSDLSESTYMTGLGTSNLGFSTGLFDFGPSTNQCNNVKDVEICRLREELGAARAKLHSWEESMGQARTACDAWKKEAALANK